MRRNANTAVVTAFAPACVEKFQHAPEVQSNLDTLKKTQSWWQGEFIAKGGWATLPGTHSPEQVTAVATACAAVLTA